MDPTAPRTRRPLVADRTPDGTERRSPIPWQRRPVRTSLDSGDASEIEVIRVIGQGAMGEVCFARDHALLRDVAYKRLRPEQIGLIDRLEREARIGAQLDHPNIVPVHRLLRGPDQQPIGYVMKLVQGEDMAALLKRARQHEADKRPPEPGEDLAARVAIFRSVVDAVAYAHDKGVVHRDLKPANVLLAQRGAVYLADWGLAKILRDRGPLANISRVQTGTPAPAPQRQFRSGMVGSIAYMSPEQANGRDDYISTESDVFALGILLYEVLTLRHPYLYKKKEHGDVLGRVRRGEMVLRDPRRCRERVPEELLAIARKATSLQPGDRYPDAGALADDLARFERGEAITADADSFLREARRWLRHSPDLVLFTVGMLLLIILTLLLQTLLH